jgi:hypothetical protein
MQDGVTGFVVDGVDEAVDAVERTSELSREMCRRVFEERFDAARMASDYLEVYRRLANGVGRTGHPSRAAQPPLPATAHRQRRVSRIPAHLCGTLSGVK